MFTQRQLSELVTAIKGRGEVPLKFAYLGKGAERWDKIAGHREKSETKGINSIEGNLLTDKSANILNTLKGVARVNILDIGCGNGHPAVPLMNALSDRGIPFRYVPIDISHEMLVIAEHNINALFPNIEIKPYQLDFELGNFSEITADLRKDGSVNLMAFLGSTLGNQADRHRVLSNFRDSMTGDDFLILGVELHNPAKINKLLKHYLNEEVLTILLSALEYFGVSRSHGEFDVKFNAELSQVETRFKFNQNISFAIGSETVEVEEGDELLVMRSGKFSDWGLVKTLSEVGYRIEELNTSAEKGYALALCQPSRYTF